MNSTKLLLTLLLSGFVSLVSAQCPNDNTFLMNASPPVSTGISSTTVNCINGGQYVTTSVIAGNTYTFSTCGNTAFDTEITVLNTATNAVIGYNDDDCGVQSTVTWVATFTGNVNVLIDQYPCVNSGLCTDLVITSTPPVQSGNGCNTNTTICSQGLAGPFNFSTPGPQVSSCLDFFGPNYAYIVLYITQSGPLEMLINGSAATGFLDVAVFNVPAGVDPCVASLSTANEISCNYASASSGCNQIGTAFPCASSVPSPMVTAGDVLFIVVENWSGTSTNFTLDLAPSPAAQTGPPDGTVNPAGPFCSSAPATQLTAVNSGGTWSGPGVSSTGVFTPSAAGVGTHIINYSIGSAPCTGSGSTTITVTGVPTVNPVPNQTICAGSATTAVNFSGSVGTATYNWTNSNTSIGLAASGSGNIPSFTATNTTGSPITGTITVTPTANGCTGTPTSFTYTINPRPTVNAVPNQTRCAGATTAAINFSGSMGSATYNWTNSNTAIGLGASGTGNIGSFTTTNATGSPITSTITVTPTASGCPGTPITFTITVNPIPTVNVIPNQTLCANAATTAINFAGNIGTSAYNWTNSNTAIGLGASGSGNIGSFTATNATGSPITSTITVTPTANGCTGTPRTFTITVNPVPTVNVIANQTLCANAATTAINFSGNTGTATYNWTNSNTAIGLGASGSGNIGSFTATNATGSPITATITVTPTANGCPGTPRTFTITVNPIPTVNAVTNQTLCANATTTAVNFSGNTGTATYNWTNSNTAIGLGASGSGNIGSFTATNATASPISATITVTPTAGGCPGTPTTFTITVNPTPTVNVIANQTLCANAATTAINFTGNIGTTTYNWTNSNTAIGLGASGSGNIGSFTATNATGSPITATITVTPTANGCPGTPRTFTITVNPIPTVNAVANQTLCANAATTAIPFSGNIGTATYNWTNSNTAIGLGASGSGNIGSFTATNATGSPISATITVTPTANGCPGTPTTFTITVNPTPTVTAVTNQTLCANAATTAINFTGNIGTTTYNWTNSNTAIGLGASGSGNIASFTATNATGSAITGTITVTPTVNGCPGTPITFTITVSPLGNPSFTTTNYCEGSASPPATITGQTGGTFAFNPVPGGGVTINASNGSITGGVGGTTYTVQYTTAGACPQSSTQTVTVYALPPINAADVSVCTGGSVAITATGAATYSWDNGLGAGQTHTVTPAVNTTYTVTGTSVNGCVNTDVMTVTLVSGAPINAGPDVTICAGTSTTLTATGGISYTWAAPISATGASQTVSPIGTTTYTVDGTDASGCTGSDQVVVTLYAVPSANAVTNQTLCANTATTGVNFSGPVAGTTYDWTNNTPSIGLAASGSGNIASFTATNGTGAAITATITVTPTANGCVGTPINFTITVNPIPTANALTSQTLCANTATAAVAFSGSMGTATYNWTNTNTAIGLGASGSGNIGAFTATNATGSPITGTIAVTPTANGCVGVPSNFTITVNPLPTANVSGTTSVCEGTAAPTITFTGANGTAPYTFTYNINGGPNQTVTSAGTTATVTAPTSPTGTFNYNLVSVSESSATGCSQTQTGTATITVNPNPTPLINGATQYCAGTTSTLSTSIPYTTYVWSTGATTPTVDVTDADNPITVTVTNAQGCSATSAVFTVSENSVITYNTTVEICQGQTATIHGNVESVAGMYAQTFTLPTGCDSTSNVTLIVNPLPVIDAGIDQTLCSGVQVTLSATGAPSIVWDNGVSNGVPFNQIVGTTTYTATGTDVNGCVNSDAVNVTINPLPTATIAGTTAVCQNGTAPTITFTGANGTVPYTFTYNINGGASQTVTSVGTTATVTAPTATVGTFNYNLLSVSDGSSTTCSQTQTGTATVTINPLPTATIAGTVTVCQNDAAPTITFTGANGTAPYTFTYNVNGGASQTVTSVGTTATVTAPTGTTGTFNYNLESVSDASSTACAQVQAGIATVIVNPLPTAIVGGTVTLCQNDAAPTITFTGANGTAPYTFTYNINGGASQTVTSVGTTATVTAPTSTVGTFDYNLVSVSDASATSCSQAQTGTATVTINPLPTATVSGTITVCEGSADQTITFTGANGTAPYTFTYNINGGASQTVVSTGATATVLASAGTAGTFDYNLLSVVDASATGCSQVQTGTATVTVNPLPTATIGSNASVCQNDVEPTITFTGANGTAPYTFTYTINGGPNQTVTSVGATATITAPTNTVGIFDYTLVSVVDASSTACSQAQTGTATITVNTLSTATISGTAVVCLGDANPTITFTGANGVAPYTFTYNVNNTGNVTVTSVGNTATISVPTAVAGVYDFNLVSVVDGTATGCPQAQLGTATVTVNALPNVFAGNDFTICEGSQAVLSGAGATSYVWNQGQVDGVAFTPATTNTYTVTGTDANGCVNTDDITITLESNPAVSFIGDNLSGCVPLTVTFTNTTPGAMDNCTWTFENGTVLTGCGSVTTTFTTPGTFDVTLETTSVLGCTGSATYTDYIYVEANPVASFSPSSTMINNINPQVYFDNTSSGAVNYAWDFGDGTSNYTESPIHNFPDNEPGTYSVELIAYSALGCTDTAYASISLTEEVIFYVPNTFTPDDDDFNPTFQPVFTSGYDPFDYTLLIFNRWGEILFESHNADIGWDGTYNGGLVQDGTYTWKIEFKTTLNDERKVVVGHVNLIE